MMKPTWATNGLRTTVSDLDAYMVIQAYHQTPDIVIDYDTGQTVRGFIDTMLDDMDQMDLLGFDWRSLKVSLPPTTMGKWEITNHTIDRDESGRLKYLLLQGPDRDCGYDIDGSVTTILSRDGQMWMSDTRAEILEHLPFIEYMQTHEPSSVLITGLGIGMIAKWAAAQPYTEKVVVVELDQTLIDLIAPLLSDPSLIIVQGDARTWVPPGITFDAAWHDIWPTISSDNVPEMEDLKWHYAPYVHGQQLCWQEDGCRAIKINEDEFIAALEAGDWQKVKDLDPDF